MDDETPEDKDLDHEIKSLQARAGKAANLQKEVLKLKGELEKMKDYEELKAILPEVSELVSLVEPSDKK